MKKILLLIVFLASGIGYSQIATGTTKAGRYQMNTPDLGAKKDSCVVWDGTSKLLKYVPCSSVSTIQLPSDWNATNGVTRILNKPTIPSISGLATTTYVDGQDAGLQTQINGKQDTLGFTPYNATNPSNYQTESQVNSALSPYLTTATASITYQPIGSYLTYVPAQSFSSLTGKPTTLSGYGITDATTISGTSNKIAKFNSTGNNIINSSITDTGSQVTIAQPTEITGLANTSGLKFTNLNNSSPAISTIFGTTQLTPDSIVLDLAGNVYVTNNSTANITKITPTGVSTTFGSIGLTGYASPYSQRLAIDSSGNLYAIKSGIDGVMKITPTGVSTTFGSVPNSPLALAIDTSGNIYVTSSFANNVTKITPAGVSTILGITGNGPSAITIDSTGNVYTANTSSNNVSKITPAGVSTILGSTGSSPNSITIDSSGNVYTVNYDSNSMTKITPAGLSTVFGSIGNNSRGIAIDSSGNIYTGKFGAGNNNIIKTTPAGVSAFYGATGNSPLALAIDTSGNIYTANTSASSVSKITRGLSNSILSVNATGDVIKNENIEIENNLLRLPTQTTALITADLTGKAVVTKEYLSSQTATPISLTTTGTSGAATLVGSTLNIPNYASGVGATNLSATLSATNVIVNSSTGTGATIPLGNGTTSGVSLNDYTTSEKSKLAGISAGATANSTDAVLLNRANHTGSQTTATITGLDSALAGKQPVGSYLTSYTETDPTALKLSNNLSDLANTTTARTNLGLGTLAMQSGTFSGTSSGTNTGDQDLSNLIDKTATSQTKTGILTTYGSNITDGTFTFSQSLLPIRNNLGGFYNSPFFASDYGYYNFRPSNVNTPSRFYIMPNATTTGTTSKFEMFNMDYSANYTVYNGFNIFTENATNIINIGPNRGASGGARMKMRIAGDYTGSQFIGNPSNIDFETDNTINVNGFNGAITFGQNGKDPFGLGLANQYTFKDPTTQATRVNIVGNASGAGIYFGRDAIRTASISTVASTSDVIVSTNPTNTGITNTVNVKLFASTGNLVLQNGGTHTDNAVDRLQVTGSISATSGANPNNVLIRSDLVAGTNYLAPNGDASQLTNFPTLNQNTTGTASTITGNITQSQVTNLVSDLATKQNKITLSADATNTSLSPVTNSANYLPNAVLTTNNSITIPVGSNGDTLEFYNNEKGFVWTLTGDPIYFSDQTVVTFLNANTNYLIRKISGKWRILN